MRRLVLNLSLSTLLVVAPVAAEASGPRRATAASREAQLEARIAQLEKDVATLREALAGQTIATAPVVAPTPRPVAEAGAPRVTTQPIVTPPSIETRLALLEAVKPTKTADGFNVGSTRFKIGGFVRVNAAATRNNDGEVAVGGLGKEFYLPQQIPVGGGFSSQDFLVQARQTRFVLNTETPVGNKALASHIEFDFAISTAPAGAQRATNAFVPTLRRAFMTYGGTLLGQEWTTFQNVGVLPESTDFVGPLEGTVFVRQAMVRQTIPLGTGLQLQVALENPETESVNRTAPTLIDNDDDRLPDIVARLNAKAGKADLALAVLGRELRVNQAGIGDTALGWGVSASGKVVFGPKDRHDLRFMVTYGEGIGRYLGLGFVPDGIFGGAPGDRLQTIRNLAAFGSVRIGWTGRLRSTLMGGYQTSWYPVLASPLGNRAAWSAAGNVFYTVAKGFDVGVEYRHAVRELLGNADGSLDRLEFAAKYGF